MGRYAEAYELSLRNREEFWLAAASLIDWDVAPASALDTSDAPVYRWFPGAQLNTSYNALDRHVDAGLADQLALIWDSAMAPRHRTYTYGELLDAVARAAGALAGLGVRRGDRVLIYMPMIPEAVITMLACSRIGAIHSVVFGGFAPKELAARIDDAEPVLVVLGSCGLEPSRVVPYHPLLNEALTMTRHQPRRTLVVQREMLPAKLSPTDVEWDDVVPSASPLAPIAMAADDPLYILYTSGTTGKPKGVVRDTGGHAVALAWSMGAIYDVHRGDVIWTASDIGWAVGHSYLVYGPLLAGGTTVMYEGKPVGTPDAGAYWRVVSDHQVNMIFTAPTAIRAIKREDPEAKMAKKYELGSLRNLFVAGERLDPQTYHWAADALGIPVTDHWWQTETGWPVAANLRGLESMPVKPGSTTMPVPGWDIRIVDKEGAEVAPTVEGQIVVKEPLPPGSLSTLWGDHDRFARSYLTRFPGFYDTGDAGYFDNDGYLFVLGRTDDVINVAGHRLSSGALEAALATHPAVAECAVIGIPDELKGHVPLGLIVLKAGRQMEDDVLQEELVAIVRRDVGPVASFRHAVVVPALPKTRSGKILRRTMRAIANGRAEEPPGTIEDPAVLESIRPILQAKRRDMQAKGEG